MTNTKIEQLVLLVKQAERIVQELGILAVSIDGVGDSGARVHFSSYDFPFKNAEREEHSLEVDQLTVEIGGVKMFCLTDKEETKNAIV